MTTRGVDLSYELDVLREFYGNLSLARLEASRILGRLQARTEVMRCSKSAMKSRKGVKTGLEGRSVSHLNTKEDCEKLRSWREEVRRISALRESSLKFRRRECCAENDFVGTLWPHWDARSGGSLDDLTWRQEEGKTHYHGKIMEWSEDLLRSRVKRLVTAFTKWHTTISEVQSARSIVIPSSISEGTRSEMSHAVLLYLAEKKKGNQPFKLKRAIGNSHHHNLLAEQCRRALLEFVEEHAMEVLVKIVEQGKCRIEDDHLEATSSEEEESLKCTLMLLRGLHSLLTNECKPSVTFLRQM